MGRGGLSVGRSSVGPPARAACPTKRLGAWLLPLSLWGATRKDDLTLSLPLQSLCSGCEGTLKTPQSGIGLVAFVNTAKNRAARSWKDPQSSETLRSGTNQVRMQQSTRVLRAVG